MIVFDDSNVTYRQSYVTPIVVVYKRVAVKMKWIKGRHSDTINTQGQYTNIRLLEGIRGTKPQLFDIG